LKEKQSVIFRPDRLHGIRRDIRRSGFVEDEKRVTAAIPGVEIHAIDAHIRELKNRVRRPERRRENVAHARFASARDGVHLAHAKRQAILMGQLNAGRHGRRTFGGSGVLQQIIGRIGFSVALIARIVVLAYDRQAAFFLLQERRQIRKRARAGPRRTH